MIALRGGHIEGVVLALGALGAHIKAGTLRGLATSNRVAEYADIPTLKELGYREEFFGVWFSYLAPAGIPEDARKALVGAIEQAVKAPAVAARLAPLGILQAYASPEAQAAEIRDEFQRVTEMVKKVGLRSKRFCRFFRARHDVVRIELPAELCGATRSASRLEIVHHRIHAQAILRAPTAPRRRVRGAAS